MMRSNEHGWWMGALALAAGCGAEPMASTPMVVESLSLSGTVDGEPVDGEDYAPGDGTLTGNTGMFFIPGHDGWIEVAACPIGASPTETSDFNPYSALPQTGGPAERECVPSLALCGPNGCTSFGSEELAFEVTDAPHGRLLSLDADGLPGALHLELGFRSTASDTTARRP